MAAPEDFAAFCRREYPRLVGALDLYLGNRHVAEELAQEALVRADARWETVSRLQSPGGWAWRVAVNLANSWFRRVGAERRAMARLRARGMVVSSDDPDMADAVAVRGALAALTRPQRAAVVGRYYLDLSAAEVGERMGLSAEAVRALTKRAIDGLRAELGPDVLTQETPDVA